MEEDLEETVDCSWAITYIKLGELNEAEGSIYTSTNGKPKEKHIKDFPPKTLGYNNHTYLFCVIL